eukprot:4775116-Prymnesium_polylepis.2
MVDLLAQCRYTGKRPSTSGRRQVVLGRVLGLDEPARNDQRSFLGGLANLRHRGECQTVPHVGTSSVWGWPSASAITASYGYISRLRDRILIENVNELAKLDETCRGEAANSAAQHGARIQAASTVGTKVRRSDGARMVQLWARLSCSDRRSRRACRRLPWARRGPAGSAPSGTHSSRCCRRHSRPNRGRGRSPAARCSRGPPAAALAASGPRAPSRA